MIEQIHATRDEQHALKLQSQEAPWQSSESEAGDLNKASDELDQWDEWDPAQNWQPNSWDSYGWSWGSWNSWWDVWSDDAQNYQYQRSKTWQSDTSDVLNTPSASQIQSAMDRLDTQEIDGSGVDTSTAGHEQKEPPKD